jgi:beta-apo-4'-carotenal oxygenase
LRCHVVVWLVDADHRDRIKDNEAKINEACKRDLGKGPYEVHMAESGWCLNDIVFICNNLAKWMKDEKAPDIPLLNSALSPKIRKDPLGVILVIGYARSHDVTIVCLM